MLTFTRFSDFLFFLSALFFTHLAFALPSSPDKLNCIAAVVNDQIITESQLNEAKNSLSALSKAENQSVSSEKIRVDALDSLIARTLQLQIAKLSHIEISDEELNNALKDLAQQHQISLEQLPAALQAQGLNITVFKQQLHDQLLIQKFQQQQLAGTITISPQEIDTLAKKLSKEPNTKSQPQTLYHFVEILIPLSATADETGLTEAKKKFEEIAKKLNQGEDFFQISEDVLNQPAHDLGWRSKNQIPPDFLAIAQKMKVNSIAPPSRSAEGIHIIKLLAIKTLTPQVNEGLNTKITETHVRHILLKKDPLIPNAALERRLLSLRNDLIHGGDFSTVAHNNSQDPGSVSQGGDLGWVKPETLDPKFEAAMNNLKINEISMPVASEYGWHLIQVLGRREVQDPQTALKIKAQEILFQQKIFVLKS